MNEALQDLITKVLEAPEKISELESKINEAREVIKSTNSNRNMTEGEYFELNIKKGRLLKRIANLEINFEKKLQFIKWFSGIVAIAAFVLILYYSKNPILGCLVTVGFTSVLGSPAIGIKILEDNKTLDAFIQAHLSKYNPKYKKLRKKFETLEQDMQELYSQRCEQDAIVTNCTNAIEDLERQIRQILEDVKQARTRCAIEYFEQFIQGQSEIIPQDTKEELETAFVKYKI